ncbi:MULTISPECIES: polyprenyl synthetase family protein [Muribaculaceae]|jgi:octaprenyl-diphosphate synthase|uniref:polyprenyl synthetase family protein n=1 Tax=Muribaculaceae TaxID=2005473 RepID=UPI000F4A271F|nr:MULTISPECIES: polyprenyl synthetase family protein [Muribaculaceae]ROS89922.1 polyprenyl synthetase family protein [Muribaculaceae bacterium Isolate-080 (Janvier)]
MSAIEDIRQSLKSELERLDTLISRTLDSSNTLMNQVIGNYLEHKGKQLRPMLVMLTARLFGGVNDDALTAAASVEILHNASLIHDDVVDDSGRRHGHATINAVWDNHVAVLVGDFFVSNALKLATETEDLRVIRAIADLGKLLSLGEMDQIYNARYHELNEEAYFNVISHKTASLFVTCVSMGAYCSGVDDWRLDAIREFAELFGRCFQIKDDIFDYFDSQVIGKPTGNDLREGKVTLPLLYALSNGASPERDEMLSLLREDRVLSDSDIRRLIAFTHENGGVEYAYATMERMRAEAVAILDKFNSPLTSQFISLLDFVIAREK